MTYLNTPAIFNQKPEKVDRENGIIKGISIIRVGEANGHNFKINDEFVSDVVRMGNEHSPGIKARFGHPNMCSTALGTYLGRFKNFEKVGSKARADLYLDNSAKKSPKGNLFEYVLDMAENNPDMFGASIAFKKGEFLEMLEEVDGKKVPVRYATIQSLHATDFVDSPAATDGLFEVFHEDDFASQVTLFLDEHPEIYELLDNKPEILTEFLKNYKQYKTDNQMKFNDELVKLKQWVTDNFSKNPPKSEIDAAALKNEFDDRIFVLEKTSTDEEVKHLETLVEEKTASNMELSKKIGKLSSQLNELQLLADNLQTELNKAKAKPTLPDIQADPLLSLNSKQVKDDSGKVLLSNLPRKIRNNLKTANQ